MKITKGEGEGQGTCKRCADNGKWNRNWMCFLYKIEGYDGCYCSDCVRELQDYPTEKGKTECQIQTAKTMIEKMVSCYDKTEKGGED